MFIDLSGKARESEREREIKNEIEIERERERLTLRFGLRSRLRKDERRGAASGAERVGSETGDAGSAEGRCAKSLRDMCEICPRRVRLATRRGYASWVRASWVRVVGTSVVGTSVVGTSVVGGSARLSSASSGAPASTRKVTMGTLPSEAAMCMAVRLS
eukprot:6188094-Pleurochrysis_carterae.AAC.2